MVRAARARDRVPVRVVVGRGLLAHADPESIRRGRPPHDGRTAAQQVHASPASTAVRALREHSRRPATSGHREGRAGQYIDERSTLFRLTLTKVDTPPGEGSNIFSDA
jgi:hypothetical protein